MLEKGIKRESILVFLLISITACAYLNSLDGEFVFDDSRIYKSVHVQVDTFSISKIIHAATRMEPTTRPVANLTFIFNYLVHKFDVRGYHLANLCIHIAAGIILYFFLKTTFSLPALRHKQYPDWIAFVSAMMWLVHPLQTQAVSYIIQRMTSLCAFFFILSVLLYVRGRLTASADRRFGLFCGSIFAGILAMGSKEIAVTLPLFILLYEWFFLQDMRKEWLTKNIKHLVWIILFLLAIILLFMGKEPLLSIQEGYALREFSLSERLFTELRVVVFYLGLVAFPHPDQLSLEHDFSLSTSFVHPAATFPALICVAGMGFCAILIAQKHRLPAFCLLWFLGNHVVEGTVLPLELVFEHRNYLPTMMIFPLVLVVLNQFLSSKKILVFFFCALIGLYSYWTFQRNYVWQDRVSLWTDCVAKAPGLARVHNNLAVALKSSGEITKAIFHYKETVRLDPGFLEAYYNLGNIMMMTGDLSQAVTYYGQAVQLNPNATVLHLSLANALFDSNRFQEALYYYQQALRIEPGNRDAQMNLDRTLRMIQYLQKRSQN